MAEYYFLSQLPSLDGVGENTPLPITEERFSELCNCYLGKKAKNEINKLTLIPPKTPEKSSSALVEAWNNGERNLRFALAKVRADKMNKQFNSENKEFSSELIRVATDAVEAKNPLEAEKILNEFRLSFLDSLRPMDFFSEEFVFYYAIKLKLLSRIRLFDKKIGEMTYKKIYNSIMNGANLEVIQ